MSACGTAVTVADAVLFALIGSGVVVEAVTATVTTPLAGTTKLTAHEIVALSARLVTGGGGTQVTTAPAGSAPIAQPADAALLGPLLVHVTVPLTVLPAGAVAGNPLTFAAMSACGTTAMGRVLTLLPALGSAVELPAVVVMLSGPDAGALNVLVHVTDEPIASGFGTGFGRQDWVAPGGSPLRLQDGAAALLGPLLVHVPDTVTGCPAATDEGTVVVAAMSACGTLPTDCCAVLFDGMGSAVVLPAVPVTVTPPLAGTVKLTAHTTDALTANGLGAGFGKQFTVAPAGTVVTAHVGAADGLGPLLVHVTVPETVLPAGAVAGKPATVACISACGITVTGVVAVLFSGNGSGVVLLAVAMMLSVPVAGAVNVLVQLMLAPRGSGSGTGLGVQVCVAPAGKPLNAHVGADAAEGPALVQVPLTVTGCPVKALVGAETLACMSACAGSVRR